MWTPPTTAAMSVTTRPGRYADRGRGGAHGGDRQTGAVWDLHNTLPQGALQLSHAPLRRDVTGPNYSPWAFLGHTGVEGRARD
jgi:hypothetical protein